MTEEKPVNLSDEFFSHCKELPAALQAKLSVEDINIIFKVMVKPIFILEIKNGK